jgi:di/tricarboxylate transporter
MTEFTPQIGLTLFIIFAAVVLFASEKLRVDIIALLVLISVTLTGLIDPAEAFSGFASPAVITVWAVYIVSGGLFATGIANVLGQRILQIAGTSEARLIAVLMLGAGLLSAFMNNIGATAVLLPAAVGISRRTSIPLSKLLIPLSFASLLGGNMTMIGTPPNVLASSMLTERGLPGLRFFDFTPTGLVVFLSGILYMILIGRHLLPARKPQNLQEAYHLREYLSEVRILEQSKLAGKSLAESRLGSDYDLNVVAIIDLENNRHIPHRDHRFRPGEILVVKGRLEDLLHARESLGIAIEAEHKLELSEINGQEEVTIEAVLSPRSRLTGKTLRETHFRDRYGFTALAIHRQGRVILERLRDVRLQFGDILLLRGRKIQLPALQTSEDFLLLEPVNDTSRRFNKAPLAGGILVLVLALTMVFHMSIALAMVIGAVLMVITGCLTMDEAYQSIDWRSVFLIAGMLPLGLAMESTGTARFLAERLVGLVGSLGPLAVLAGIYILASLITEPMSNAAATVLIAPISIDVALSLGADPRPFVLAVVIGASTSFLTPVGHQSNILVMEPGGYRFTDYTKVGAPLNVVLLIAILIFLPLIWPLF